MTADELCSLYPPIEPWEQGWLDAGDGHQVYYEESGNPRGVPVLFLHGGPGSCTRPHHRRYFDPQHYRIVLMDQRGCGRSRPLGAIAHNTTHHLIRDVESLRQHLAVDSWLLFGGSWGSSLALAYAVANPGRASGLILRGVFLATRREVDWFLYGLRAFIPIAWDAFADGCKDDVLGHYLRLLDQGGLPAAHAARRWGNYENAAIALGDGSVFSGPDGPADSNEIARVRIQTHYLAHDCFLQPDELLERMSVLSHLPAEIVQGCLDMVCPPETAVRVSAKLPRSRLTLVPGAGHSATHPALASNLVAATDRFRNYLEPQS